MQFWREGIQMRLETLVGGTQIEKPHKLYKDGDGKLLGLAWIFHFLFFLDIFYKLLLISRVWRDSSLGIPSPSLSNHLEGFLFIFPTSGL